MAENKIKLKSLILNYTGKIYIKAFTERLKVLLILKLEILHRKKQMV